MVDILLGVGVCAGAIMTTRLANATWGGLGDMIALATATFPVQTDGASSRGPTRLWSNS